MTGSPATSSAVLWVVSELYYPEETSTGFVMTRIAEGLAARYRVKVLCGFPSYEARHVRVPARERHNGVEIERCRATRLDRSNLVFRMTNAATLTIAILMKAVQRIRHGDAVLVVTNPPTLPFMGALACRLRGAKCVLLVHDVYPEALIAAGVVSPASPAARVLAAMSRRLWRGADRVIAIGRDMQRLIWRRIGGPSRRVVMIPNWADADDVRPQDRSANVLLRELGLERQFVVQLAGNLGRVQGLADVLDAATALRGRSDVHFLVIGSGSRRRWFASVVRARELRNVTILPSRPRTDQTNFLNACDVALVPLVAGMAGVGMPSRLYNVLAAGKPVIVVADDASDLAAVVREEGVGWVVSPGRPGEIAKIVLEAQADTQRVARMGLRARAAAQQRYAYPIVMSQYHALFEQLLGEH